MGGVGEYRESRVYKTPKTRFLIGSKEWTLRPAQDALFIAAASAAGREMKN